MNYIGCQITCSKSITKFIAGQTYLLERITSFDVTIYHHDDSLWSFAHREANEYFDLSKINKLKAFW